jgi:hypothetical protein
MNNSIHCLEYFMNNFIIEMISFMAIVLIMPLFL